MSNELDETSNLNIDDYSYNEAIELFNISETDNLETLNKKYNNLREIYENREKLLEFIDNVYLKIINQNESDNNRHEKKKNFFFDDDDYGLNKKKYGKNISINNNITEGQALDTNNHYDQKFAVNQITPNITKEVLCIDSNFKKNNETSSNFVVELPHSVHNVIKMRVASIEIPQTEYFFSEEKRNNIFYLVIDYNSDRVNTFDTNKEWVYVGSFNPSFAVIKIKIPDGIWYSSDMSTFINNLLDTAHKPYQNLIKFEIQTYSGKSIFRFKIYDELTTNQKSNIESAHIYNKRDSLNNFLKINPDDSDMFGPKAYFSLSLGNTYITSNNNDKIYDNIIDIQNEIFKAPDIKPETFELSTLFSMGYTLSQIYDKNNNYSIIEINKNSKNLKSDERDSLNISSINDIYLYYFESNNIYAFNKFSYSYLSIEDFVGNFMTHISVWNGRNGRMTNKNIIARVQTSAPGFTVSLNNNSDQVFKQRNYFGPVTIKKLHIELLDAFGKHINLNSNNLSLILEFVIIYHSQRSESYQKLLTENIKFK